MAYVESSLISRTGYGDASFDQDLVAAFKSHQGVNGVGDLPGFITSNAAVIGAAGALYFLFFHKKRR